MENESGPTSKPIEKNFSKFLSLVDWESYLYQDYEGAFAVIPCLRSARVEADKALKSGNMSRYRDKTKEIAYWADQFIIRRASARRARGTTIVVNMPELPKLSWFDRMICRVIRWWVGFFIG